MQNEKVCSFRFTFPNSLKLHGFPARLMGDGKIARNAPGCAAVRQVPRQLFGVEIPHLTLSYAVHLFYQIIDFLYKCTINTQFKNDMFVNATNYLYTGKRTTK